MNMEINENLSFTIDNNIHNIDYLLSIGFEEKCGSCAQERPYIRVLPFLKMFWEDSYYSEVKIYSQ